MEQKENPQDIDRYFEEKIWPTIKAQEAEHKKAARPTKILFIIIFIGMIIFLTSPYLANIVGLGEGLTGLIQLLLFLTLFSSGVGIFLAFPKGMKKYKEIMNNHIIPTIISYLTKKECKGINFYPEQKIPEKDVRRSNIFGDNNFLRTKKLITAELEGLNIRATTISIRPHTKRSGRSNVTPNPGYGVFLETKAPVGKDVDVRIFAVGESFRNVRRNLNTSGEKISLESIDFEDLFEVYGDQIAARRILTPAMMNTLMNISKKLEHKVYFLSIEEGALYICIPTYTPFISISYKKDYDKKMVKEYIGNFESFFEVAKIINQQNWSKN